MYEALRYRDWLTTLVNTPGPTYKNVCNMMFDQEFLVLVAGDENRVEDGYAMRDEFVDTTGVVQDYDRQVRTLYHGPNVLEVVVGLARRISNMDYDPEWPDKTGQWFHVMCENLGLQTFPDYSWVASDRIVVNMKLRNLVERRYDKNGRGGLFPLKVASEDQTKVQIWTQMNTWYATYAME